MEGGGLSGRMYANMGGGMLGLEMPLNPTPQTHQHLQKHPQILAFTQQQQVEQPQTQLTMKQPNYSTFCNQNTNPPQKSKTQYTNSDEDEPSSANDHENGNSFDGKRKSGASCNSSSSSMWHRMKWTDSMVRLLIMAVYYIGDEAGGSELGSEKKKSGSGSGGGSVGGGGGGLLQKKGKWKSVSRAMMEKGFCVSPQQCEDKFNDLNKRYKRVNDILGKGTACKVVENQSLLDTMDLSPKRKEEVRKLLHSKHLFFREMCAYHNSCGHGTNAGATAEGSAVVMASTEGQPQHSIQAQQQQQQPQQAQQQQLQQSSCLHSAQLGQSSMVHNNAHRLVGLGVEDDHDEDEEDEDDDDEDEDEFDEEEDDHEEGGGGVRPTKRARMSTSEGVSTGQRWQQLSGEVVGMLADGSKSLWEKKQWVMTQLVQLEEQGVKFQYQALELEKQRLKWIKFSGKKEREMERMKIENERKRLENERMVLLLRRKEVEFMLVEQQHHIPNPSSVTT